MKQEATQETTQEMTKEMTQAMTQEMTMIPAFTRRTADPIRPAR
jgi:hypothetical protein